MLIFNLRSPFFWYIATNDYVTDIHHPVTTRGIVVEKKPQIYR